MYYGSACNLGTESESDDEHNENNIQTNIQTNMIKQNDTMITVSDIEKNMFKDKSCDAMFKQIDTQLRELKNLIIDNKNYNKMYRNTLIVHTIYDFNNLCINLNTQYTQGMVTVQHYYQNNIHIKFCNYKLCKDFINSIREFNNKNHNNKIKYFTEDNKSF